MTDQTLTVEEHTTATPDTWFSLALARRQAEQSGEVTIPGARFNSFI